MKYKIGRPFWKIAYRLGVPIYYSYNIFFDRHAKRYFALSEDIGGLVAEADTIDEIKEICEDIAQDMIESELKQAGIKIQNKIISVGFICTDKPTVNSFSDK